MRHLHLWCSLNDTALTNLILQVVLQCVVTFIEVNCDWHVRHNIMTVLTSDLLHKRIYFFGAYAQIFMTERDVAFLFCCVEVSGADRKSDGYPDQARYQ